MNNSFWFCAAAFALSCVLGALEACAQDADQSSNCFPSPTFEGFETGVGIGGWLTNYKRFNVLPENRRLQLSVGDFEHFDSYITESDVQNIASFGVRCIRLGFDQVVVEESPGVYRERIFALIDRFINDCEKYRLNVVLNLHKAIGNYCDIKEDVELLDDEGLQDRFVALWIAFEERYADKPNVAFELLNEIREVDPQKWNDLAERTIKA
ncbi:MAG: cellulase family glycosylhydrolase, partial [Thermoguttaceae bacterium]|nr:cellulase family glycosylhydrolase [Thermoguttaceae bacterium]